MEGDIAALMRATLNAPVASQDLKEHFGRSLIGPQAGDSIGDGLSGFASFFVDGDTSLFEDLLKVRPIRIGLE